MMPAQRKRYDAIIIGAGVSGPFIALELVQKGMQVLMLEAGEDWHRHTYPRHEIDANSRLYWSGGIELNTRADLGLLRPKAVGGGSIVNQALLDRFDDIALDSWREQSGVDFFRTDAMAPWYEQVESQLCIQEIPAKNRNGNAQIFKDGFDRCGHQWAPLTRAQKDCRFEDGNDCIECLAGCRIDSKQSSAITVLKKARQMGLELISSFEVASVQSKNGVITVAGQQKNMPEQTFSAGSLVMAAGAIGNSKILLNSGLKRRLPALGENFFCHPQSMVLGIYDRAINAHKGPLQSLKSNDANFRLNRFKLENVFAPPVAIAMLIPGIGREHHQKMRQITHMACIEVAVRDSNPGRIERTFSGKFKVIKNLNEADRQTQQKGINTIHSIFRATGAKEIINGSFSIGLHLMGGMGMGVNPLTSVVGPDFRVHGFSNIYAADSSIFPNAPGINPSLTIMALSKKAAQEIGHSA
jgi:choline dehydrogenase-like flavoprotein